MPAIRPVNRLRAVGDLHGADEYSSRQIAWLLLHAPKAGDVAWPQGGVDVDTLPDMTRTASELVLLRTAKDLLRVRLPNAECSSGSLHRNQYFARRREATLETVNEIVRPSRPMEALNRPNENHQA